MDITPNTTSGTIPDASSDTPGLKAGECTELERRSAARQRSLANLRPPWRKGCPPQNSKGYPKGQPNIKNRLKKYDNIRAPKVFIDNLRKYWPELVKDNMTTDDATFLNLRLKMLKGDSWGIDFYAKRTEGNVAEVIEVNDLPAQYITIGGKEIQF